MNEEFLGRLLVQFITFFIFFIILVSYTFMVFFHIESFTDMFFFHFHHFDENKMVLLIENTCQSSRKRRLIFNPRHMISMHHGVIDMIILSSDFMSAKGVHLNHSFSHRFVLRMCTDLPIKMRAVERPDLCMVHVLNEQAAKAGDINILCSSSNETKYESITRKV